MPHSIQNYLCEIYRNFHVEFKQNNVSETYGEILYPSVQKILNTITFTHKDTFLDIGSGMGKVVLQVYLNTKVESAVGIEINTDLHKVAQSAALKISQDERELKFYCADVTNTSLPDATIVLLGSPCFSPSLITAITEKLIQMKQLHSIFTMRPIECDLFQFKRTLRLEASWDTALCYLYERRYCLPP